MNLPIIINYFECENCLYSWRIFRSNKNVFRSRCLDCNSWTWRERRVYVDQPRTDYCAYGKFECHKCEIEWTSAYTWILYKQKCKICKKKSYPVRIYDKYREDNYLNPGNQGEDKMHKKDYCDKCWEVGDCTTIARF